MKCEGAVDHIRLTRRMEKFYAGGIKLDDQGISGGPKTVISNFKLQV